MSDVLPGPAYRVVTERLVVRCWEPGDIERLRAAIASSLDHLRPWMPWAHDEPRAFEGSLELMRSFRGRFDLGEDFTYGIFDRQDGEVLGGTGLHTRIGPAAREIGYWIAAEHEGRGYVTEAAAALTRVAFEVDRVDRVEIHCDPANARSAAVPRRLGYDHEGTLRRRVTMPDGPRDAMVWSLFADRYPSTPAARTGFEAYDVLGRRLR